MFQIVLRKIDGELDVVTTSCECKAGQARCSHIVATLYCLASYKRLGYTAVPPTLSKTSRPQQWHIPSRDNGIQPARIDAVTVCRVKNPKEAKQPKKRARVTEGILPTLYCPIQPSIPWENLMADFSANLQGLDTQFLWMLEERQQRTTNLPLFGTVPAHSILAQQNPIKEQAEDIIFDHDAPAFPCMFSSRLNSSYNTILNKAEQDIVAALKYDVDTCVDIEEKTRNQTNHLWKSARRHRLTASNFHRVVVRKAKEESLAAELLKIKGIQTKAMKDGLEKEPVAARKYAELTGYNVLRTGVVINPTAPHLAASPDRKVYDAGAAQPFGLLEIKCPSSESYTDCKYLRQTGTGYSLKTGHAYYYQVMGQMALTGLPWCDFFVMCEKDFHMERIKFDENLWNVMKEKLDVFFFRHFLPAIISQR